LFVLLSFFSYAQSQRNCGTTKAMEYLYKQDPTLKTRMIQNEKNLQEWIKNHHAKTTKEVIVIPVVVHVLYYYNIQNISDAQIQSQIDALNADYRRLNADTVNTPSDFKSVAADVEIEFCFAHQDPNGNWTNGVTRTQTSKTSFDVSLNDAKFTAQGGIDAWDRDKYLNIWVVPSLVDGSQGGILGYAQFPGGPSSTDGVVIAYRYFGTMGTAISPFNKGRTTTHEIGHWLSLYHIWGDDGQSCSGSDHVNDTPNQASENYGCQTYPSPSCNNVSDMFMNYMDYSDDTCMNMFTEGQKQRMLSVLNTSRASLKTSNMCNIVSLEEQSIEQRIRIYPNPSNGEFVVDFNDLGLNAAVDISVYTTMGQLVYQKKLQNISQKERVELRNSPSGIYMVYIKSEGFSIIKKIEIQR